MAAVFRLFVKDFSYSFMTIENDLSVYVFCIFGANILDQAYVSLHFHCLNAQFNRQQSAIMA